MTYSISTFIQITALINIAQLILLVPNYRRIFSSSSYGGYILRDYKFIKRENDVIFCLWLLTSFLLLFGFTKILASLVLSSISYYYFIRLRFISINRGMGAPGYFNWFLNKSCTLILIIESVNKDLLPFIIKFISVEFGLVFIISGLYKRKSGYLKMRGLNVGLVNPQWSYFPKIWQKVKINSVLFRVLNYISIWAEIIGGAFIILPGLDKLGATIITITFLVIAVFVRLGVLCHQIIVIGSLSFINFENTNTNGVFNSILTTCILVGLTLFISLQIFAYYINYSNLIYGKEFNRIFQKITFLLNQYYGISLWRVFTSDITSIYVEIYSSQNGRTYHLVSEWQKFSCSRFRNVGESITVTSIFTTLKYFPSNLKLFQAKLLTYSLTFKKSKYLKYKVYYIVNHSESNSMRHIILSEFLVNSETKKVKERVLDKSYDLRAPDIFSSVKGNSGIGTKGF